METIRYSWDDILSLDKIFRINLINSAPGFKSANLIGTCSPDGTPNLATFSSVIHLGSNPPLLGFMMRPPVVPRHTYDNICATGVYTINHINEAIYPQAHQTSAKYEEGRSEFEACHLTPEYDASFKAPFVKESIVKIGMSYCEEYEIQANQTILIVGKIEALIIPKACVGEDGFIDLARANTLAISGVDAYCTTHQVERLPYARPDNHE
jgi:flavin reductase (DIM6/NTAB) family NADH-FMN oxidoreductase RutF